MTGDQLPPAESVIEALGENYSRLLVSLVEQLTVTQMRVKQLEASIMILSHSQEPAPKE